MSSLGTRNDPGLDTSALLRQVLALGIVILLLGGCGWLVLKKGLPRLRISSATRSKEIVVLETAYLPPRQAMYLVQVGTKKLLLSGGKEGLRLLADVTDGFPDRPTAEEFRAVLSRQEAQQSEQREETAE